MSPSADHVDVTYCEGWRPQSRAIVGVLPAAVARGRDSVGEQYAVLLGSPLGPNVLIEVSWRHDYAAVWFFDGLGRREAKHEFRRLTDERLFLLEIAEWEYDAPEQSEFDEAARVRTRRFWTEGHFEECLTRPEPGVGLRVTRGRLPAAFDWDGFIEERGDELLGNRLAEVVDPESGANLIAFASGWGDGAYPTWVGRTADGEVACFVADLLVLHHATVLP